ncbi:MAG: MFS transporter [Myxococcota bacterium]
MRDPIGPNIPFSPKRSPIYYGWIVVGAATVGIVASIPGQTMGVSVFTDPLLAATGLSRLGFSNAYLVGTLLSASLLPWAGRMLDRFGVRIGASVAALGLALTVFGFAEIERVIRAVNGAPFVVIAGLFLAVRFSGQGVLTLASRTMIGRWFERRRGTATAISGLFVAFSFALAPRILDAWIAHSGWQGAYREIALVEAFGMVSLALLLFREDPESAGLLLDGVSEAEGGRTEVATTRSEALRTRAFWVLTLALAWHALVLTGATLHIVDLGAEQALSRTEAVGLFVPMALVSTSAGAAAGWLADRMPIRTLLQAFLVATAAGYASLTGLGTTYGYAATAFALGMSGGLFGVLPTVGLPRFFGREHLGTISGASMTAMVVGSALGPSLLAASRQTLGSYRPACLAAAVVPLALALFTLTPLHPRDHAPGRTTTPPTRPPPTRQSPP